jgi:hypothetical protein
MVLSGRGTALSSKTFLLRSPLALSERHSYSHSNTGHRIAAMHLKMIMARPAYAKRWPMTPLGWSLSGVECERRFAECEYEHENTEVPLNLVLFWSRPCHLR